MQTFDGNSFLHERNHNFHATPEVEGVADYLRANGESIPNEPSDKISAYLGFLVDREYVNDGILTGNKNSIDRQLDRRVIDAAEVPEGYFDLQRRIAREQGRDPHITPEMRQQMTEAIQVDQRAGLDKWVEYLGGADGGYPDWFKHYTWTSVTKLGAFDKEKSEFQKRSRGTTAPYPELNREALAYVYDALDTSRLPGEQVHARANNAELKKLVKGGNFGKLYAHAVLEVIPDSPELRNEIRGSWAKFNQTDDPRTARRLAGSLQGHGTGWCTAAERTAMRQLHGGDFYVYYTHDEAGKDTIPRIAIRMEQGSVAEVRGINAAQELEINMADITAKQLEDLPGGEAYIQKAQDMKRLTALEKKITTDIDVNLSREEVGFLYELDHEIQGFGYVVDPRISEMRKKRGEKDKPELNRLMPEIIREQLSTAYVAYTTVAEQLYSKHRQPETGEVLLSADEFEQLFTGKDAEWQSNGIYAYLADSVIKNGSRFNLVATPNITASEAQIIALAEKFGKDQPRYTSVNRNLYLKQPYSSRDWSGDTGTAPIRLSLMPNHSDSQLGYKSASEQIQLLRERQTKQPELQARVPSLLDAVTYWYSLRAHGDTLNDTSAYDKTNIRHFDLGPIKVDGMSVTPSSVITRLGQATLNCLSTSAGFAARVAVG